jgi:hypothetical protein
VGKHHKLTLQVSFGLKMIKIIVGDQERVFVIHKNALIARSIFFKNAMGARWREGQNGVVKLPDDDGDAFALYE